MGRGNPLRLPCNGWDDDGRRQDEWGGAIHRGCPAMKGSQDGMLSLEGQQLGNYDITRRIRVGGMGAVYEGRQRTAFDRRVAIKVILGDYATDPDMRRRFAREARTIARLHHPHILPLIEFGDEQGVLYLVMPFIEGGTLTGYLRRHLPDLHEVASLFGQVLDAVEYAHEQGLIHRDIKSSNVLLEPRRAGPPYAYLADFGLVRTIQQADLEASSAGTPIPLDQVPGTPHYMAPEQTWGIVTPATDIYALGVLLYQMLTGELPYLASDDIEVIKLHLHAPVPDPCEADASIPAEVGQVVKRAMAKRAEQRFATVGEFREAWLAALAGPGTRADTFPVAEEAFVVQELPPRPLPPVSRPPRLRRASQQLPLSPEPIELIAPPAAGAHQRITEEEEDVPRSVGVKRHRVTTGSFEQAAPRLRLQSSRATLARPRPAAEPTRKRRHRFRLALVASSVLPVLLILLVLVTRLLGLALLPPGFPLFGASPVATIALSVKTAPVHDTFLLTASPQVTQADVTTRLLPDRRASGQASDKRTVATSGLRSSGGTQATGLLDFTNPDFPPITISKGFTFIATNGVQISLDASIIVPAHSSTNGVPAHALEPGTGGNIGAGVLNTVCCGVSGRQVSITNLSPFSGGTDATVTHLVAQNDLTGVKNQLVPQLQQQALQQIKSHLQPGEVQAGQPTYTATVTSTPAVGQAATQVTVMVTVSATALVYNTTMARELARQLLSNEARLSLGPGYQPRGSLSIAVPTVEQQTSHDQLYLSISASGLWVYSITSQQEEQWRQAIKGASLTLAQSYLSTRPGIMAVHIQLPFGTDHLPIDETQIVFVVQPETSALLKNPEAQGIFEGLS